MNHFIFKYQSSRCSKKSKYTHTLQEHSKENIVKSNDVFCKNIALKGVWIGDWFACNIEPWNTWKKALWFLCLFVSLFVRSFAGLFVGLLLCSSVPSFVLLCVLVRELEIQIWKKGNKRNYYGHKCRSRDIRDADDFKAYTYLTIFSCCCCRGPTVQGKKQMCRNAVGMTTSRLPVACCCYHVCGYARHNGMICCYCVCYVVGTSTLSLSL
jgi:hypothetical protein